MMRRSHWQVEEAKLKERQAAAAAAADEVAGGSSRKAFGGEVTAAVATQNGEGDALSISSSVVQVCPDSNPSLCIMAASGTGRCVAVRSQIAR